MLRQAERARAVRERSAREWRQFDYMEDWSPTSEELDTTFREQWAEEHTLVWTAHQLERWEGRLRKERGEAPVEPDELLKNVRDALEHLDEVDFRAGSAVPPDAAGEESPARRYADCRESSSGLPSPTAAASKASPPKRWRPTPWPWCAPSRSTLSRPPSTGTSISFGVGSRSRLSCPAAREGAGLAGSPA